MSNRRLPQRPSVTETNEASTSREAGRPLYEDQIRGYRNSQRVRYDAQRAAQQAGNFVRKIVRRNSEEHIISMVLHEEDEPDLSDYPALAQLMSFMKNSEVVVGDEKEEENLAPEEEEVIGEFLTKLSYDADSEEEEDTRSCKSGATSVNIAFFDEYPELKRAAEAIGVQPTEKKAEKIFSSVTSGSSYRPPDREMTEATGYAPATSTQGWGSTSNQPHVKGNFKWKDPSSFFTLPTAHQQGGAMFVMPSDFDPKVFERWESVTLNHMADKNFSTADDKLIYMENLLGEIEKITFQTWRMQYPDEFALLKGQAMGSNGTQNVISQFRRIFYLEDPKQGTTHSQDAAYKAIKSLVCNEMSGIAIKRYMASYFELAARTGRMWLSEELSNEFFTKLPNGLGDRISKAFSDKYPGNTIGVPARITFTQNYLTEICREAAYQRSLKNLDFCREFPIPGYYKAPGRKYGVRKTTTYRGKPHKTHIRVGKPKHLRDKKCRCYACGEEGHFAKDCRNPRKLVDRVHILENLEIADGLEVVSVGEDEDELSDIYSLSEGEEGLKKDDENLFSVFALVEEEPEDFLIGKPGGWRQQMRVSRKQYHCSHEWDFNTKQPAKCGACGLIAAEGERMQCVSCKILVCSLCSNYCYGISVPRERKVVTTLEDTRYWRNLVKEQMTQIEDLEREKEALIEELNRALDTIREYKGKGLKENTVILQEVSEEDEEHIKELELENELLKKVNEELSSENKKLKERIATDASQVEIMKGKIDKLAEKLSGLDIHEVAMITEDCEKIFSQQRLTAKQSYNGLYNVKVGIEVEGAETFYLNAIVDTGATVCWDLVAFR